MIAVVQVISTHVGLVGRQDLQTAVGHTYGSRARWLLLISILAISIVTIGADLEGGAAAIGLITHLDWRWFVLPLSLALLAALMLGGFGQVERALKYVLLCLLAYSAAPVLARPDWETPTRTTGRFAPREQRSASTTPRFRCRPQPPARPRAGAAAAGLESSHARRWCGPERTAPFGQAATRASPSVRA